MNLNHHGWGLKEMILLSSILFAFLLVSIFMIIRLYSGLNKSGITDKPVVHRFSYEEIENNVLEAGIDYYNEYYAGEDHVKVTVDRLRRKSFITSNELRANDEKKSCTGYVEFEDGSSKAYIKCDHYITDGYEE